MSDDSFQEEIRESFIFYRSFFEALQGFDNETVGECVAALCEYALNGQMKETNNPVVKMFITLTKPQIDANNQRYSNGCKGGAPSGNQNAKKQPKTTENNQKQPTVDFTPQNKTTENNQKQPNENVNVNDNVFFKEKEKEKESSTEITDGCFDEKKNGSGRRASINDSSGMKILMAAFGGKR